MLGPAGSYMAGRGAVMIFGRPRPCGNCPLTTREGSGKVRLNGSRTRHFPALFVTNRHFPSL